MSGLPLGQPGPYPCALLVVHLDQHLAGAVQRGQHVGAVVRDEALDDSGLRPEAIADRGEEITDAVAGRRRHRDRTRAYA